MRTFIANFGEQNYEWPECHSRNTVATMNDVGAQPFWEKGDREGYIASRMKDKTARGITPTRPVASRWFNLMTIIAETHGDIWIHREKDQLWWTMSLSDLPTFEQKVEPVGRKRTVIICHKPCERWSNQNRRGNRLDWSSLHPKAREFLFTEGTLQQLGQDNSDYANALINGDDLTHWHSRQDWQSKAELAKHNRAVGTVYNAKQRSAWYMANTAEQTTKSANGQQVLRTIKNKEFEFKSAQELEQYLLGLIDLQNGLCALTGLTLQYEGEADDAELLCSLDRIDSKGHYAAGNLQIVCRFANRWKNASDDGGFRRLIDVVRSIGTT